jgi:S-adenosylmethionine hydrolase
LAIDKAGNGYTLNATTSGLTGAGSAAFAVATADHLLFQQQPTTTTAGQAISPAVMVAVVDQFGNVVTDDSTDTVTLVLGTNPGGGTLSGTRTVTVSNGIATFSNLSIDKVGTGYTLNATTSGLTSASSAAFTVNPAAADHLLFRQQPTTTTAGQSISPAVTVYVLDKFGNIVTTDNTDTVTVALGTNPGSGTLSGTLTVTVRNGVATFSNLSIDKIGTGYTLNATASGLTGVSSAAFTVNPAAADHLLFQQQPTDTAAGRTITPAVTVAIVDQFGNVVTNDSSDTVTLVLGTNPGSGTLSGTLTVTVNNGIATFSNLSIDKAGNGYTLNGSSFGLTSVNSATFRIT